MLNKDIKIQYDSISSEIFGYPVVDWHCLRKELSVEQIINFEQQSVEKYDAQLISVVIPSPTPTITGNFEACGFNFIDYRFNIQKQIKLAIYKLYPFVFIPVADRAQLEDLLKFCNKLKFDDRYSIDPAIDPLLALERNKQFLRNSFEQKTEHIYVLMDQSKNSINGFRTYKLSAKGEASLMLSGAVKNDKAFEYNKLLNYLEINELNAHNIKTLSIVVTTSNYAEINWYISELGCNVVNSSMVLRKMIL